MYAEINYQLQDSGALLKAVDDNRAILDDNGLSAETYTALVDARAALTLKEGVQNDAVNLYNEKTNEQDRVVASVQALLKRVRAAAQSAYGRDKDKLEPFNINQRVPSSLKQLRSVSEYISGIVDAHKDDLLKSGLLQEDLDNLSTASERLDAVDTAQENARKMQKSATIERNAAAKELRDHVFRFRKFIKARFRNNPELAVQFEPIPKGKGRTGSEEVQAAATQ